VHCTVTRQQVQRDGYLEEFAAFGRPTRTSHQLWFSLYTPQVGEVSPEILTPADRERFVAALMSVRAVHSKVKCPKGC
jgi:hypothetical protein